MPSEDWKRVNRDEPCPVCSHWDWGYGLSEVDHPAEYRFQGRSPSNQGTWRPPPLPDVDRRSMHAYHESGHAMGGLLTGGEVVSVAVHPNGEGVTMLRVSPVWAWFSQSSG